MFTDLTNLTVDPESSIHQAIGRMDISRIGIILVVDADRKLLGTITDGDIRRANLTNISLDQPVTVLLEHKADSRHASPITAPASADRAHLLRVLQQHKIHHLPLVDTSQRVVALVTLEEFVPNQMPPIQAVVMAGGFGRRLLPLTEKTPKSMLPVGDRPLIEIIIQQLRAAGIERINVAVHHESEQITQHLGDGRNFGVSINYVTEDRPLGTAGALGLMESPHETNLVINGDILTQVDFHAMLAFHREYQSDLTVAVQRYGVQIPFGVVECQGAFVHSLVEKPSLNFLVNAGMYLLEPSVYGFIPVGVRYDMTDLIQRLLDAGRPVVAFPVREYWLDIGQHEDYWQAQETAKSWKPSP
jgi:dTDP-glucose pyrophosphorylase